MKYPDFFKEIPVIKLYDPLSDFLGAIEDGIIEINYSDVVKFAGHSCPTVAGAYLMCFKANDYLLNEGELLERGNVRIIAKGPKAEGTNGVVANVAAYIFGVNDESGFEGIAGRMGRKNKLFYDDNLDCDLEFEYNGNSVKVIYNSSVVKQNKDMIPLLQKCIGGTATEDEQSKFKKIWQNRVKDILLNEHNGLIIIKKQ